jgi:hypothetical protein
MTVEDISQFRQWLGQLRGENILTETVARIAERRFQQRQWLGQLRGVYIPTQRQWLGQL